MEISACSSYIRRKDMDSVLNCLITDSLAPGDFTERFVKSAKDKFLFDYGSVLRSPMIAFDTALSCFGLEEGDCVALSPLSPAWAIKVLENKKLKAHWLEIDKESGTILESSFQGLGEKAVKLLYIFEACGLMTDPSYYIDIGLPIIEDASYSLGAAAGDLKAGSIGTMTIVSLENACSITGGGGALLYAKSRREGQVLRNVSSKLLLEERMGEMNAAIALSQIRDVEKFIDKRRELLDLYLEALSRANKRTLFQRVDGSISAFSCVLLLDSSVKDVCAYAKKKEVGTLLVFEDSCIAKGFVPEGECPNALSIANRAVAFPLNQRIGNTAAQKICKVLASLP